MDDDTTAVLIQRSRSGDPTAFRQLLETQHRYVYTLAWRMLGQDEEVKDAVQETFIRVWKNLARFDGRVRFTTWLYKITANVCLDRLKSRRRRQKAMENLWQEPTEQELEPEQSLMQNDLCQKALKWAQALPDQQRMIFILRDLEDLAIAEVCEITGLRSGAIKTHLYLARKFLRQKLSQEIQEQV